MRTRILRVVQPVVAAAVSLLVLGLLAMGFGTVPALGKVLDPGAGVWNAAVAGELPRSQTIQLDGLGEPVRVSFDANGVPDIEASSNEDLFLAQGYVQATFRTSQLDLERRLATGQLAALVGPSGVASDKFELQTGLLRTAQAEWADTPAGSPAAKALTAYAEGVNLRFAELRRNKQWPATFTLAGVYPANWTPVDSLAIQELLTQNLDYTTAPLDYEVLKQALGSEIAQTWFPTIAPDAQQPYDAGPYRNLGITPLSASSNANAAVPTLVSGQGADPTAERPSADTSPTPDASQTTPDATGTGGAAATAAATDILDQTRDLPVTEAHLLSDSNAWVANGPAVASGKAMLAGDPHLQLSLPSYWYQMALASPQISVTGASLVGLPGILIGRNAHISWSLTDVQNQSTIFYDEETSSQHPGQYYWKGAWRTMRQVKYTIPVRGGASVPFTVDLTVHGPVMTKVGQTTSVDWMGNVPSPDMSVLLSIDKAANFGQFRAALSDWHAPTLNFAYADDAGNIGMISAGYFPLTKASEPWEPVSGTGGDDIIGVIPYAAEPQSYNPPGHVIASANQRPVTADYPYYIGTSMNAFDNGYRADTIYQYLNSHRGMTAADFSALQNDVTDHLAQLIVPRLKTALSGAPLSERERQALDQLDQWNDQMTASSTGATIWLTFWNSYLSTVFQPWWNAKHVPVKEDSQVLKVSSAMAPLDEDLEAWTLHNPGNAAFTPPGASRGSATGAMRAAFTDAISKLFTQLGGDPATWSYGKLHSRSVPSLTGATGIGYGPAPAGGDSWTVDAADGGMDSSFGPSWRMVVDWTAARTATAQAVYPGGQSENPSSPWYDDLIPYWWAGRLLPMRMPAAQTHSTIVWTMQPGR
jgi:penicillin amidase